MPKIDPLGTLGAWAKFHGRPFPGSGCAVLRTRTHKTGSFLARGSNQGPGVVRLLLQVLEHRSRRDVAVAQKRTISGRTATSADCSIGRPVLALNSAAAHDIAPPLADKLLLSFFF